MFEITLDMKRFFLDREEVKRRLAPEKLKLLRRGGGTIRKIARRSLRKRRQPSRPGQVPAIHSADKFATLKNILFALTDGDTVITGPVGFRPRQHAGDQIGPGDVTEALELGAQVRRVSAIIPAKKSTRTLQGANKTNFLALVKAGRIQRPPTQTREVKILPRPFMGPALATATKDLEGLFEQ